MSGRDSQRGFIFQSIIAMIECLERNDWDEVKLEPDTKLDKVDIQLYSDGTIISAIQVKSSKNQFERFSVSKWLTDLRADAIGTREICLYLVGDSYSASCEEFINQKIHEIKRISFTNLEEICTGRLISYVKKVGIGNNVRIKDLELIDASLFSKIHRNSIAQERLTRSSFEEAFRQALPIHSLPKCLTKYVPLVPDIGLMGRDSVVAELRHTLEDAKCIVLVSGLGGIGKTAVMQKVCDDIIAEENDKNHVAWITCGENMQDDLLELRDQFRVPKDYGREQAFDMILREIKNIDGRLYLFMDDMARLPGKEELGILNALRPNVLTMITSRHGIHGITQIDLTELDKDSIIDMFYGYYERDKEREYELDALRIIDSDSVKRHTLLVELLAKAAKLSFGTLDKFRNKLEEKGFFEVSKVRLYTGHDENQTIEESVKKLYDISDLSIEQEKIMSLFAIFTPDKEVFGEVMEWAGFDENEIDHLVNLGWLIRSDVGFAIHQIIRDSIARQIGNSLKLEEYGELLENIADTNSYMPRELEYTEIREKLVIATDISRYLEFSLRGLINAGEWSENEVKTLFVYSRLLNNIAGVFADQGDNTKALDYYGKAIFVREHVLGTDHPDTSTTYNNIALVYSDLGDYNKALEFYNKALIINERTFGIEHPLTATIYNNIALAYVAKGEYTMALEYHEKALAIEEKVLGTEDLNLAKSYNNIAIVYNYLADYAKALDYFEKSMFIREKIVGTEHPDTATVYDNIACLFCSMGDYAKAQKYSDKAIDIRERVLGKEHPSIVMTYNNKANIMSGRGDYIKALRLKRKALAIADRVLGEDHSITAAMNNSLASEYESIGNYAKAMSYYKKALDTRERILGKKHPDTANTYGDIAKVYFSQGDYTMALDYYQKALAVYENVFGTEHTNTVMLYSTIITAYRLINDYEKALEYCEKTIAIVEREPRIEYPNVAVVYNNVACVYRSLRDFKMAFKYYEKARIIWECELGSNNPTTAVAYYNMAMAYDLQSDYDKAIEFFEKALAIRECSLGIEHPSTIEIYINLASVYEKQGKIDKAQDIYKKVQVYL